MKRVEAIIRPEKLDVVLSNLQELGYPGAVVTEVAGHGSQKGITELWKGKSCRTEYLPKIKLEIVVKAADADKVVESIAINAYTHRVGDGKIFVSRITDAIRVRTGEQGEMAI